MDLFYVENESSVTSAYVTMAGVCRHNVLRRNASVYPRSISPQSTMQFLL
jgi:hypothetical protein